MIKNMNNGKELDKKLREFRDETHRLLMGMSSPNLNEKTKETTDLSLILPKEKDSDNDEPAIADNSWYKEIMNEESLNKEELDVLINHLTRSEPKWDEKIRKIYHKLNRMKEKMG